MTQVLLQGATHFSDLPLSDRAATWSRDDAFDRVRKWASSDGTGDKAKIDWEKLRSAFFWYDAASPEQFGSYKLMFADVVDGTLTAVWAGVTGAAAVIQGARGGVQIPDSDRPAVKTHIARYYDKAATAFEDKTIVPPWENKQARTPPIAVRTAIRTQAQLQRDDAGRARVQGTLVTYGARNENGWLHVPGAAQAALAERRASGLPLPMGYQHHPLAPLTVIGRWDELEESRAGIQGTGLISDTTAGRDAATLVEDQAIAGISIGFCPCDEDEGQSMQLLAPGQTGLWQTPYGPFSYTADDWTLCFSAIDLSEASLVHQPADDAALIGKMLQSFTQAATAMPGLESDRWEDVAYSMALLMGGRGAAAFSDLGDVEHFALYQRLAAGYRQHGKTAPAYDRRPEYGRVNFQHDERLVFADRFLRKTAATLTATARGIQGQLSPETSEVVNQARAALAQLATDGHVQTNGLADELRALAQQSDACLKALQKETP